MPPRTRKTTAALAVVPDPAPGQGMVTPVTPTAELDQVGEHPRNVRSDLGDLTELTASVAAQGVLQPLMVAPNPAHVGGDPNAPQWIVIAGHRRLAAARAAKLFEVPITVRQDLYGDASIITAMLTENLQRRDLTPIEEATAYVQLELLGMKPAAIAKATGRSRTTVDSRLRLMDLPEDTRGKVHAGQLTLEQADQMAEFADDPKVLAKLAAQTTRTSFDWELQHARNRRSRTARDDQTRTELLHAGYAVYTRAGLKAAGWDGEPTWTARLTTVLLKTYTWTSTDQRDALVAEHQACAGHGVLDPGDGGTGVDDPIWVCALGPGHHEAVSAMGGSPRYVVLDPTDDDQEDEAPSAGSVADTLRRNQTNPRSRSEELGITRDDVETAAALRRTFILGVTASSAKLPADEARDIAHCLATALAQSVFEPDPARWLWYLDRDSATNWADVDYDIAARRIPDLLQARDPHRMLLAALAADIETNLDQPHNWIHPYTTTVTWLRLLVGLGYELSKFERDALERVQPPAARPDGDAPAGES